MATKKKASPPARRSPRGARLLAEAERLMAGGRALLALPLLDEARELAPADEEVWRLLAIRGVMLEDAGAAVAAAREAVARAPARADLWLVLGRAHKLAGSPDDAIEGYRRAVNLDPNLAEAHVSLGIAFKLRGQLSDAIACYRRALEINPRLAAAHANLGNALVLQAEQLGSGADGEQPPLDEAADAAQRLAVELDPTNAQARANWARALDRAGRSEKAVDLLNAALGLDPHNEDICLALVGVLFRLRMFEVARDLLSRWLPANPGHKPGTLNCMATTLLHLDRFGESLDWAHKAEARAPTEPDILYNIGVALIHRLQVADSLKIFRRIVSLAPHYVMARESLVLCLNYVETDPLQVLQEHRAFGAAITRAPAADAAPLAPLQRKQRLRVGFLSGDLRRHSVGYFVEALFEAHDPTRIELVAYHSSRVFDEVSARLKAHTQRWVACEALSDDDLVRRIRADAIDVLIDLSGTTADGRPEVFAQRAAPVQISYLGYPTTTGIPAMDYRISDAVIDPPGEEGHSTEQLLRCPDGMFCYRPDSTVEVGEPPLLRNGFVTFGSFNNLPKYSEQTLALWAEVLHAVPGSKLLLKAKALADAEVRQILGARLATHGIGSDRLVCNPWRPDLTSHLELYREIDIALDTFPYNGATTTCEALWAGVPVLSLRGRTHTSRMGASILTAIGRPDWVSESPAALAAAARRLAGDASALSAFRSDARRQLRSSPLLAGPAQTRHFEDLLFQAWEQRCEQAAGGAAPASAAHLNAGADALFARGEFESALAAYRRGVAAAPQDLLAHWGLARTLASLLRVDDAIEALRRVVELDPAAAPAWFLLAGMYEYQGWVERSRAAYDRAEALAPGAATRICRDLLLPSIVPFGTDLKALRAEHEQRLLGLLAQPLKLSDPLLEVNAGPVNEYFRLAYHGLGNRRLHGLHAALQLQACPGLAWVAPHCRPDAVVARGRGVEAAARPIRIGFISRFFRQHSIGKTSVGLIERLARPEFHVTALFVPPRRDDAMAERIAQAADAVLVLPAGLADSREAIAALQLDILFYQDIGMEPHSYYLAFARLAAVQCVSFGHPDTTGIPNLDAWISSSAFEPAGAQADYSERLVEIPDVGTLACYERPVLRPGEAIGRGGFGLPEGVPLLACPQGLFKFHPEMDELLAALLQRLPNARFLLVQGDVPAYKEQLVARWRARGDGIDTAAVFFPPLEHQSYLALFAAADVVLDTLHFNGMNSSLEALSLGAPVVTWPREFQRGRHTQGMYRRMGFTELVAAGAAEYVELAVRLCTDAEFNRHARAQILARCGVLFDDPAVVRGFEQAFRQLLAGPRGEAALAAAATGVVAREAPSLTLPT